MKRAPSSLWITLPLLILAAASQAQQGEGSVGQMGSVWNLGGLPAGNVYPTTLTAQNLSCKGKHDFEISVEGAPWLEVVGPTRLEKIGVGESKTSDALVDLRDVEPGDYRGTVVIRCLTCPPPPLCVQSVSQIEVRLTVREPERGAGASAATEAGEIATAAAQPAPVSEPASAASLSVAPAGAPEILRQMEDLDAKLEVVLQRLASGSPGADQGGGALPPVEVTADSGDRFRNFLDLADRMLVQTSQDFLAIRPEDDYTRNVLTSASRFVLAARPEISQLTTASRELSPLTQAHLDAVVVDGAPEVLSTLLSSSSRALKLQLELDGEGNELVKTILEKVGMTLSAIPIAGGLINAVLDDVAKLFEGASEMAVLMSGMSLAQLELELKLDAIVRGLFGVSIDEALDETALRQSLREIPLGAIPERLDALEREIESLVQKLEAETTLLKTKVDNLARETGVSLRGVPYEVEPDRESPPYGGPDHGRSSVLDQIELLRLKLDNLGRILGLSLYGPEMGFPRGFDIEPPDPHTTVVLGEEPKYPAIKPEIEHLEAGLEKIIERLERLERRLGRVPRPIREGPPLTPPPPPPPGDFYVYLRQQLALSKKIYVYEEGTFTARDAADSEEIVVETAAFDLAGWVDLTELREGDAARVAVEVSVADGPFRTWSDVTFRGRQERGLKYFTDLADGLQEVVGTEVRITLSQTASAAGFETGIPIRYQFIVESQN